MKAYPLVLTAVFLLFTFNLSFADGKTKNPHNLTIESLRPLLDCMWDKESSKRHNPPDGDKGKAIGAYQIWKVYWQDAIEFDPSIGGTYQDCRNKEYAEKIILAYWKRYTLKFKDNPTVEQLARIHNGGPTGYKKESTVKYWKDKAFDPVRTP